MDDNRISEHPALANYYFGTTDVGEISLMVLNRDKKMFAIPWNDLELILKDIESKLDLPKGFHLHQYEMLYFGKILEKDKEKS